MTGCLVDIAPIKMVMTGGWFMIVLTTVMILGILPDYYLGGSPTEPALPDLTGSCAFSLVSLRSQGLVTWLTDPFGPSHPSSTSRTPDTLIRLLAEFQFSQRGERPFFRRRNPTGWMLWAAPYFPGWLSLHTTSASCCLKKHMGLGSTLSHAVCWHLCPWHWGWLHRIATTGHTPGWYWRRQTRTECGKDRCDLARQRQTIYTGNWSSRYCWDYETCIDFTRGLCLTNPILVGSSLMSCWGSPHGWLLDFFLVILWWFISYISCLNRPCLLKYL